MIQFPWGGGRSHIVHGEAPRCVLFAFLMFFTAAIKPLPMAGAQPSLKGLGVSGTAILFGTPSWNQDGFSYLQTGALANSPSGAVPAVEAGTVLFTRRASVFGTQRFGGAKEFTALAHDDGIVSIYSGNTFMAAKSPPSGRMNANDSVGRIEAEERDGGARYTVRLYDGSSGVWINPALFADSILDKASPKIEQIALQGSGGQYFAVNGSAPRKIAKSAIQKIPQGEYALSAAVTDAPNGNSPVSGVFRLKVLLNGTVALDKKFDAARAAESGLSFLGLDAPSANCLDREGRIVLGRQFIPRGQNTLDVTIFDFAGNSARYVWSFATE